MWTWLWLPVALADAPMLVEPGTLELVTSVGPVYDLDPLEPAARCVVRAILGEQGAPTEVEARGCVGDYRAAAEEAVRAFRWKPPAAGGSPARAATLVPIRFTPKGRLAIEEDPRCVYVLQLRRDGSIAATQPLPQVQCQLWPPARVKTAVAGTGACEVTVDRGIRRDQEQWLDLTGCPEPAHAAVTEALRNTLFAFGTEQTRFRIELPEGSGPAPVSTVSIDIPTVGDDPEATRIQTGDADQGQASGLQNVPSHEAPTAVKFSLGDLLQQKKEEDEAQEEAEDEDDDG